jgi:glutamate racemase
VAYRPRELPIGVFDSGVGGLTVLRALREHLPDESFLYLGDTARLPYGTKSPHTVERYALQAAQVLVDRGIKLLVIACNTASAVAVTALRDHFAPLPLTGVVEPGADAAVRASASGHIAVIGTESTIRGGAYDREIRARRANARVTGRACPLFVALAEEGWVQGPVPEMVARRYLEPLFDPAADRSDPADCLVLGCTHFPVLAGPISRVAGPGVVVVDSAHTTAVAVERMLVADGLAAPSTGAGPRIDLLATDDPARFARVGATFLGLDLAPADVELVDL